MEATNITKTQISNKSTNSAACGRDYGGQNEQLERMIRRSPRMRYEGRKRLRKHGQTKGENARSARSSDGDIDEHYEARDMRQTKTTGEVGIQWTRESGHTQQHNGT